MASSAQVMSAFQVKFDGDGHVHLLNKALKKLITHSQDISIVARDGELKVNRLLLLMFSPTISSAISELNSSSSPSILFPDFSLSSVRALIDLLVSGSSSSTNLSDQDFRYVLEIAKLLQIQIEDQNAEMVKSKFYTELTSNTVTKSMKPFETKSLNDFKVQEDDMLPNDGFTEPNIEDDYGDDETNVKVEVIEDGGEKSIYLVRCKESWGEFHQDKFVSGGKGHCILFNERWMTPNDFERLAGSKAKKYKDSLYVNGKPLKALIDPDGTRMGTPSVKQKQISNLDKIELGTPVKGKGVQGSISQYFTPKGKKQDNNLDEPYNQEVSPSRGDVNVSINQKGKSRIADIADSKKRKRQSNDVNCTKITESKKMQLDIMPEANAKDAFIFKGEDSSMDIDKGDFWTTSGDGSCNENPLIIDLNYADNCHPPMVSGSNTKQIINQEMMDSIQFEKESNRKEASVETSKSSLGDQFLRPVAKKVNPRYSVAQTFGLRKAFDESNWISKEKAQELSKDLCLTENQVKHWFKKSRAKKRAVTNKPVDNPKVNAETVDKIEHHLEGNVIVSTDEKVHKMHRESKNLFEAYSNIEYQCKCECGVTFKNAKLLMFHKHICPKTSELNVAAKGVSMNSKGDSSNDETGVLSNGFPSDGKKDQCTCTCGETFENEFLLNFHKHVCPIAVTKEGI